MASLGRLAAALLAALALAGQAHAAGRTLAKGTFSLPAAQSFDDPGFHHVVSVTARMPGAAKGRRLVLLLRDASRPAQTCASEHPLSGCATVDWADFPERPHVPAGGVFRNALTLQLGTGPRTFFLSQTGTLAPRADRYSPG